MIKRISVFTSLVLASILFISVPSQKAMAQDVEVSYQNFYDQLAPYGQWVSDPSFGDVFVPNVPMGFRPYASDGYWAMTDQGNMWMSNEPWAWACYHYGRWTYNGYYGWVWIPGYQWAPAWVSWRSGGGYYGWAPMGPGYAVGGAYNYPENYWVFVTPDYLYRPNVYEYYGHESPNFYIGRSAYITETYGGGGGNYYYGPRAEVIERETHQPVQVYRVASASQVGAAHVGGNAISIYRPAVNQASIHSARPENVVSGAGHEIGRTPEPISPSHQTSQPAFRQQMQQQRPQEQQRQPQQQQQRPQEQERQPQQQREPQQQQRPQEQQQQRQPQQQREPQQQQQRPQEQQQRQPQQQQRQPQQQQEKQPQQQQREPQQQQRQPQQQQRPQQPKQTQQQKGQPQKKK